MATLDPEFDRRLRALLTAAQSSGQPLSVASGYRSPEDQARAINSVSRNVLGRPASFVEYARGIKGYAAPVGGSMHQKGLAADLAGGGLSWAHRTAADYGLRFPPALAKTDPIHLEIDPKAMGPFQDPRDMEGVNPVAVPASKGGVVSAAVGAAPGSFRAAQELPPANAPAVASAAPASSGAPSMAMPPSNGWTPESVESSRRIAKALMGQGMDSSPVGHWTQALARVLQTGVGTAWDSQANVAEREGKKQVGDFYNQAMSQPMTPQQFTAGLSQTPWGRDDAQGFAKAIIAQQIKGPDKTNDQKNYERAQADPAFRQYLIDQKQAGRTQVNIAQNAEKAVEQKRGEASVKAEVEAFEEARSARQELAQLAGLQARLERLKTGPTAPAQRTIATWARDLGVSPQALEAFGIPKDFVGDANSFEAAVAGMLVGKIGSGGFPANNFSNADREFLEKTLTRLANDPRGNRLIVESSRRIAEAKIERARTYQQWRQAPENKGKTFFDFDFEYGQRVGNKFDDLVQEARQMMDSAGDGYLPQPTAPGQPPPQQNQGVAPAIQQGRALLQSGQIDPRAAIESAVRQIQNGKPREKVIQRLQELGIPVPPELMNTAPAQVAPEPAQQQRRGTLSREVIRNG
jgi:hypothetical protein